MPGIKQIPASERPREKLLAGGPGAVSNTELLALLIGSGSGGKSALTLASEVLTMPDLADASPEELARIPGIGPAVATRILAGVELGRRLASEKKKVGTAVHAPEDAAGYLEEALSGLGEERFYVLLLNVKNAVIGRHLLAVGGLNGVYITPREAFKPAVRRGASSVVIAHNHPSGDPEPSPEDIELTKRITKAGDLLGIRVVDHLIFGDGVFVSMNRRRLL